MKERWQKISALALAAALTLLGGVQVFADGEQAPLTVGQSGPQPVLLTAASAETGTDGLQYSYNDEDLTVTVSRYTGTATELVIPAEVTNGSVKPTRLRLLGLVPLGEIPLSQASPSRRA